MITLQFETTSTCNAKCHFCVYPKVRDWRAGGLMDMDLFKKIVDEAATIPPITTLIFHGLGEPTLDPKLEERIAYATLKMPKIMKNMFTNGVYLTPDRFERLKAAGIGSVIISLNAVSQEQHTRIMGLEGKFDQVVSNTLYAIEHNDDVNVEVHAVINKDEFTAVDGHSFLNQWGIKGKGGFGLTVQEGNWAGDNRTIRDFDPSSCCFRAIGSINVLWNGIISACCFDPLGKLPFGDLNKHTLRELYNAEEYVQFREAHAQNRADQYDICRTCTRI